MKFSSPVLFVAFLFGVALAEEAGSAHQMVAPLFKRGPTDQEKADEKVQRDAAKAEKAAEKEASRSARESEKSAAATATIAVSLIHNHLDT